ncbi:hypothetical protein LTR08_008622 [Meristemomyces frigidus]|nr:hypothetical protein LTR08_008622 [Meristemomyces frigidus]
MAADTSVSFPPVHNTTTVSAITTTLSTVGSISYTSTTLSFPTITSTVDGKQICSSNGLYFECYGGSVAGTPEGTQLAPPRPPLTGHSMASSREVGNAMLLALTLASLGTLIVMGRTEGLTVFGLCVASLANLAMADSATSTTSITTRSKISTTTITRTVFRNEWPYQAIMITLSDLGARSATDGQWPPTAVYNVGSPAALLSSATSTTTGTEILTAAQTSAAPTSAVQQSTTGSAPMATQQKAETCHSHGLLSDCSLPVSNHVTAGSGAVAAARTSNTDLLFLALAATLTGHFLDSPAFLTLLTYFLGYLPVSAAGGTSTYIPLPELIVNASTTASSTITETVYVPDVAFMPTPTVTVYVAPCTPYCASVDGKGQCLQARGCKGVVSGDGKSMGTAVYQVSILTIALMGMASVMSGFWIGRVAWVY